LSRLKKEKLPIERLEVLLPIEIVDKGGTSKGGGEINRTNHLRRVSKLGMRGESRLANFYTKKGKPLGTTTGKKGRIKKNSMKSRTESARRIGRGGEWGGGREKTQKVRHPSIWASLSKNEKVGHGSVGAVVAKKVEASHGIKREEDGQLAH